MGRRGMYIGFCWRIQEERDYQKDLHVGERITLRWILERKDMTDLAQDRDQWRALANTVMTPRIPYNVDKFLSSSATFALFKKGSAPWS
jgi:hypothetical protein